MSAKRKSVSRPITVNFRENGRRVHLEFANAEELKKVTTEIKKSSDLDPFGTPNTCPKSQWASSEELSWAPHATKRELISTLNLFRNEAIALTAAILSIEETANRALIRPSLDSSKQALSQVRRMAGQAKQAHGIPPKGQRVKV